MSIKYLLTCLVCKHQGLKQTFLTFLNGKDETEGYTWECPACRNKDLSQIRGSKEISKKEVKV